MTNIDFITGLPRSSRWYDSIQVIVETTTISGYLLAINTTYSAEYCADLVFKRYSDFIEFQYPSFLIEMRNS